jgi:uncharacterized protein (TIGR03437 family)
LADGWADALLVVDEPQPANQSACLTPNGLCTINSTGIPQRTYDGSSGHPNIFQGEYGSNTLTWRGIPFDPPGTSTTRVFRFTNLRVATPAAGGTVEVLVSLSSGQVPVDILKSLQSVAIAQIPIATTVSGAESSGGRLSKFVVNVSEQFANVLKSNSSSGAALSPGQSQPGGVSHEFETGFYNPNLFASLRGNLSFAGLPDNGTRVRVRLNSVPAGASISAPLSVAFGAASSARLIAADTNGIGPYTPSTSTGLLSDKGVVTAIYEITQSSATASEILAIPFTVTYANGAPFVQSLSGDVGLAPVHPSQTADAGPIPRFNNALQFTATAPREPLSFITASLPNGALGTPYTQTLETAGGLLPHIFSSVPLIPAPGLTLGTTGILSGTPTTIGTFTFAVTARDSTQAFATKQFSLTIGGAGSLLQTSASKLDFSSTLGGSAPPLQTIRVTSSQPGQAFLVTVDSGSAGSPAPSWIQVTPTTGTLPGLLTVSVNQNNLPEGTYSARIRISIPANPNLQPNDITITMVVKTVAPKLESSVPLWTFATPTTSPGKRVGSLLLRNAGGGGGLPFTTAILQRSSWITSITPASGTAGPLGTPIHINIDSTGLAEGIYRDVIRFTSAFNIVEVPVLLRITPAGPHIDVSPAGVRFSMRQGARSLAVREIRVLDHDALASISWTAALIRGSEYFDLAINTTTTPGATGTVKLSTKPETVNLAPGSYYGLLRIAPTGSAAAARYVVAVLQVNPAAQAPELDFDTGGLVFTAFTGSQQSRRVVTLNAATQNAVSYQAAASMLDGANWLSVSPGTGTITSAQSVALTITVDPRTLRAGIYRGEVTVATSGNSQTLAVLLIVSDAASEQVSSKVRAAACSPDRMAVGPTALANNFTVPAGWPATLTVEVRDNCGAAISNATVVARFSNGDPPMTLDPDDLSGTYSNTWQPGTALEQTNVTISALNADFPEARATLVGSVQANNVPTLARGGVLHNLDPKKPGGLLSPGLVAQVYGTDLATATEGTFVPLPTLYKGTSVLVGAYEAPIFYVNPGQLNVQLPSELAPNQTYPILVTVNGAITIPDLIDVVAVQPGVAAFSDGKLVAQHSNYVLVDAQNPAKRGEFLIMYLVGLGATNPPVATGALSPGIEPLGRPTAPATVTIDGAPAEVVFSGLTPSGIGLFQINFKVPDNARLNVPLEVLVRQGGYTANVSTLTVVQ